MQGFGNNLPTTSDTLPADASKIVVQKYGGSSLATTDAICRVARKVADKAGEGFAVVVVVSAMGKTTDELLELARQVSRNAGGRDLDTLLGTGETTSAALLSLALQGLGVPAIALSGRECGILTNAVHTNARILEIRPDRIHAELGAGRIVVATGFQGVSPTGDLTSLGRGGSDLTAVALTAALDAEACEIFTDVDGVYDADPRVVPEGRLLERISHTLIEEMAWHGARVLKGEAVELARDHGIIVRVASSFGETAGTLACPADTADTAFRPHRSEYTGVSGRKDLLRLSLRRNAPATHAELFAAISSCDLVFGHIGDGLSEGFVFISTEDLPDVEVLLEELGRGELVELPEADVGPPLWGAVTVVGFGLGSRPAALYDAIRRLGEEEIAVVDTFTGRESLTFVVAIGDVDRAMRIFHRAYLAPPRSSAGKASTATTTGDAGLDAASATASERTSSMQIFEATESSVRSYCRIFPAVFRRASGSRIWDEEGREYIDFFAGAGALSYGHNEPRLKRKLIEYLEADGIVHSLDMATEAKRAFLERFRSVILAPRQLPHRVQFTGPTGTNAVEAALKLARKVTGRSTVVHFKNAFHGMTLGSLGVSGNPKTRQGAGLPLGGRLELPYGAAPEELGKAGEGSEAPAAIILETIQAEGGVHVADAGWLRAVEAEARKLGALLIVDDIQVGCGRTGTFFSFEEAGIRPDLICLSKSISGFGLPMALLLIHPKHDQWRPGEHTGTFRGLNLAFVTAAEVLDYWQDESFSSSIGARATRLRARLEGFVERHEEVEEVRGRGLIQGLVLSPKGAAQDISRQAFERGLILETCGPHDEVLKFLPPLVIDEATLEAGLDIVESSLEAVLGDA